MKFCAFVLERQKHTVISAENGREALEKLSKEKPDLILLDVMLPEIDGYSLQVKISEDPTLCRIPVVVITALKPAQGLFDQFKQVAGFLSKPFTMDDLTESVKKALNG